MYNSGVTPDGNTEFHLQGARIRSLREARGWEAGVLAYKTGLSRAHIYRLESGDRPNASAGTVGVIARALNTTIEYLIGATNDPRPLPRSDTPDLDPEHLARLQRLAARVARLPEARKQVVMDALLTLLNVEDTLQDVQQETRFLPESEEDQPSST